MFDSFARTFFFKRQLYNCFEKILLVLKVQIIWLLILIGTAEEAELLVNAWVLADGVVAALLSWWLTLWRGWCCSKYVLVHR